MRAPGDLARRANLGSMGFLAQPWLAKRALSACIRGSTTRARKDVPLLWMRSRPWWPGVLTPPPLQVAALSFGVLTGLWETPGFCRAQVAQHLLQAFTRVKEFREWRCKKDDQQERRLWDPVVGFVIAGLATRLSRTCGAKAHPLGVEEDEREAEESRVCCSAPRAEGVVIRQEKLLACQGEPWSCRMDGAQCPSE